MTNDLAINASATNALAKNYCSRCPVDETNNKLVEEEEIPAKKVDLARPIFKFVKVFPYHKRYSGTSELKSVKMRLVIQFNKSTQTS